MMEEEIPTSWIDTTLGQIGSVGSSRRVHKKDWKSKGVPFYRAREIAKLSRDGFVEDDLFITRELFCELLKTGLAPSPGDLMITGVGTIGVPYIVKETDEFYFKDASVLIFKNEHELDSEYLFHYFTFRGCRQGISKGSKGTTVDTLTISRAVEIPIPFPPLNEQKRIVAKIEELFSELDSGEESLRRARRQLGVYRQSLLKQAFEGKLTATWHAQNPDLLESPDQLLSRIQSERQARYEEQVEVWKKKLTTWQSTEKGKKPQKPRALKTVTAINSERGRALPELPTGWGWTMPEEIASPEPYSIGIGPFGSNLKVCDYRESGVPLLFVRHISRSDFKSDLKFVSSEKAEELIAHCVQPLDLLIAKMGDPPGDCEIYPNDCSPAVITADCLKFRIWDQFCDRRFVRDFINSSICRKQLGAITKGVAQKKISVDRFKSIQLPLCSLPEQQEIVRQLDEQFTVIEQNELEIDAALKRSEALRQSILKKAFSGQLVPQDPNDEPAADLLARIRTEREAAAALTKAKKKPARKKSTTRKTSKKKIPQKKQSTKQTQTKASSSEQGTLFQL